ncbi:hypothetical protein HID58_063484, partial [Brassica napus]
MIFRPSLTFPKLYPQREMLLLPLKRRFTVASENDVALMSSEENNLIEILEEGHKVDIAKYFDYVSTPQAGAIATFSGTTRDTFEGRTVMELRYEAYVPMATRYLSSICASARSNWDIHKIAVAHRLGPRVRGGLVCSPWGRFRRLIDELKASVPIWKKEVYANGEVWKENAEFLEKRNMWLENIREVAVEVNCKAFTGLKLSDLSQEDIFVATARTNDRLSRVKHTLINRAFMSQELIENAPSGCVPYMNH